MVTSVSEIGQLPQPGVQVVQEFTDQTPVIVVPTLVPCVVGIAKEIRELYNADGTLNSDIIVDGPAVATAPNDQASYTAMDGLTLQLRASGGVLQTFTMPTGTSPPTTMTAQEVANAINGATPPPLNFSAYVLAEDSDGDGVDDKWYVQLRTLTTGNDRSIQIVGGTAVSKFGWGVGQTFYGLGSYIQDDVYLKQSSFPDPRGNLEELNIDEDTIRVFVDLGTAPRELLQTESFLRRDGYYNAVGPVYGVTPFDDGDGDTQTPYIDCLGAGAAVPNFLALPSAASITGIVDLSTNQPLHNKELILQVDGGGKQTVKFVGQPIVSTIESGWNYANIQSNILHLTVNGVALDVTFSGAVATLAEVRDEINAASVAAFGFNIAYTCGSAGEDTASTHLGLFYGAQPGPTTQNIIDNTELSVDADASSAHSEIMGDALEHKQLLGVNAGSEPIDDVVDQINSVFPSGIASWSTNFLKLLSTASGVESKLEVDSNSTALGSPQPTPTTDLGFDVGTDGYIYYGNPFALRVGDAVYADGTFLGNVSEIHPLATQGRIKLDREVSTAGLWTDWYILAKNLDAVASIQYGVTVPTPDVIIDTQGDVHIKHDILRDISGAPIGTTAISMYVSYEALRLDVTSEAEEPALLTFNDVDELQAAMDPISPDNPLAYGIFCALGNSGGVSVAAIGVDEDTADKPYGTLTGFTKSFDFLESEEVYGIAPLTSDLDIALAAQQHVNTMSAPEMKGERIVCIHLGLPSRKVDDTVASGTDGDSIAGGPPYWFDTKIPNLSQLLMDAGLNPAGFTADDEVFLDLASDGHNWNVIGPVTNGTQVQINTTFSASQNTDNFFQADATEWTGALPIVSDTFALKIRGSVISDKNDEVVTVYNRGQAFADRRVWMMQLDKLKATVNGVSNFLVEGFYMNAAKVGMVGGQNPAQPFTNFPVAVFTGVTGTSKRFNTTQLNKMAAGGADLFVQDDETSPVYSRMQVTTRMTSIEEREQSIVKAVDYSAKFYRMSLKVYIGRYNITQSFLDTLSTVAQGLGKWLEEEGKVVDAAELNNLIQDENSPDTVLIDVILEPLYPCNYIQITLII